MNYKQMSSKKLNAMLENAADEETRNAIQMVLDARNAARMKLEQAGVPSIEVTALEEAKVVEHIGDYLSEVTSQVLWLMNVIPSLNNETLDKLEEKLTNEWDDSPIFEDVRDHIMAAVNSYRQNKILKELDEKFKQLQTIESDYNVLDNDCRILFDKLTKKNFDTLDTRKYRSRFVDEIYDYYIDTRNE